LPLILTFDKVDGKTIVGNQQELTGHICIEGKGIHKMGFNCKSLGLDVTNKVEVTTFV